MRSHMACILEFLPCTSVNQLIPGVWFRSGPEELVVMFALRRITPDSIWASLSELRKEYLGMSGNVPSVLLHNWF